jgi:hypothetical protein
MHTNLYIKRSYLYGYTKVLPVYCTATVEELQLMLLLHLRQLGASLAEKETTYTYWVPEGSSASTSFKSKKHLTSCCSLNLVISVVLLNYSPGQTPWPDDRS